MRCRAAAAPAAVPASTAASADTTGATRATRPALQHQRVSESASVALYLMAFWLTESLLWLTLDVSISGSTWNMTVGVGPVLNGGLHLSDMHINQTLGSHNYSLHWRDGHVAGFHPTVYGWLIGNHSMMPAPNTPHFNW